MPQGITSHYHRTGRHSMHYLQAGDDDATPIIFVHGWPELSRSWRNQLPFMASLGYRAIAPDMRGYGNSQAYKEHGDYALRELVADMVELIDGLGIERAIWVGHDWGSPVVWAIARHHPERVTAVANLCVPYDTLERGWDGLLPYIDRDLYDEATYPAGQWEYQRFYEEQFDKATDAFDSDPYGVIKLLFRSGDPAGQGQIAATARTRIEGGWFGGEAIPDLPADTHVVSEEDLQVYAESLSRNSFYGPDSYYMNHAANAAYTSQATTDVLEMPVLFLHGRYDYVCETLTSSLAKPMREKCKNLSEAVVDSGHWMAQEAPDVVNAHLEQWLSNL